MLRNSKHTSNTTAWVKMQGFKQTPNTEQSNMQDKAWQNLQDTLIQD